MDPLSPVESAPTGVVARDLWLERAGGRAVLRGASIDVPRGAVTALLAPSGAGKSTLLRCLNRLLEPDRGVVTLDGVDVRELEPCGLRRRVGLVAQTPVMLPGDVAANVGYALGELPAERVEAALAAAGLDGSFAGRRAEALSGGEQARVAIARALAREPEVLLLDEPTAALDAEAAEHVGATLVALARGGIGVCLATHDVALADRIADRRVGLEGSGPGSAGGATGAGRTAGASDAGGAGGASDAGGATGAGGAEAGG